jgi:hypothetical protein
VSEVKEAVTTCFASQVTPLCDAGIQKLVQHYDKCLNNGGKCVEKYEERKTNKMQQLDVYY